MVADFISLYAISLLPRYDTARATSDATTFPKLIQWIEFFVCIIMVQNQIQITHKKIEIRWYSWKGNSTGWGEPYLVEPNCSGKPLINDSGCWPFWSEDILVANIDDSMKWSDSKQLAVYIGTLLGYHCLR